MHFSLTAVRSNCTSYLIKNFIDLMMQELNATVLHEVFLYFVRLRLFAHSLPEAASSYILLS